MISPINTVVLEHNTRQGVTGFKRITRNFYECNTVLRKGKRAKECEHRKLFGIIVLLKRSVEK